MGKSSSQITSRRSPYSPRNGHTLVFRLCLVIFWEQPVRSIAGAQMQQLVFPSTEAGWWSVALLQWEICEVHSEDHHKGTQPLLDCQRGLFQNRVKTLPF